MQRRRFLEVAVGAVGTGLTYLGCAAASGKGGVNQGAAGSAAPEPGPDEPARPALPPTRIARVDVRPIAIPFRREFRTSAGLIGSPTVPGPHVYVRIETECGVVGWGEARPARAWTYETPETVVSTLRTYLAPALVGRDPEDIPGALAALDREIAPGAGGTGQPIAKGALDVALWDIRARRRGLPLAALWGRKAGGSQALSFTICGAKPEEVRREMEEARAQGYRHFNSKVGKGLEEDRTLCEAIRQGAPEGAFLWADANRGLSLDGARRLLPILRDLGFGALEQPLRDHHGHELALLKRDSGGVRILVDEALGHVDDLRAFIREDAIHGITLKLARMGGISPNLEALELARANGLDVLVSGLTESGVNLVAASILGAAFAVGFPAALNGPQLLAESCLIGGWPVKDGRVELSGNPGLGVEVDERALERLAREA